MKDNADTRQGIALTAAQLRKSRSEAGLPPMSQEQAERAVRQANLNVERAMSRKG